MENKININDLMIGNLVNYEQTTHIITGITDRIISSRWYKQWIAEPDYECSIDEIKPIPLNEEILLKSGFVKHNEKSFVSYYNENLQINFINNKWLDYVTRYHVNYLHELQNIYYWRTKQHLQINL
jgi:hypothetical protein